MWWWTPKIQALRRQTGRRMAEANQVHMESSRPSSVNIARPCLKTKQMKTQHNAILLKTAENVWWFSSLIYFQNHLPLSEATVPMVFFPFPFQNFFPCIQLFTYTYRFQSPCKVHLIYFPMPAHWWSFEGVLSLCFISIYRIYSTVHTPTLLYPQVFTTEIFLQRLDTLWTHTFL